jgi:hypothetical protein
MGVSQFCRTKLNNTLFSGREPVPCRARQLPVFRASSIYLLRYTAILYYLVGSLWLAVWSDCQGKSQADLIAPTQSQAPTRYAEVGNMVEVGDEEEAEEKAPTSLRDVGPPGSARASEIMV